MRMTHLALFPSGGDSFFFCNRISGETYLKDEKSSVSVSGELAHLIVHFGVLKQVFLKKKRGLFVTSFFDPSRHVVPTGGLRIHKLVT